MRVLALCVGIGLAALGGPARAADQVIDLSEFEALASAEILHAAAEYALTRRRYNIEENTATMLVGEQDDLRVEIMLAPGRVLIRWKEGFGHKNDQWLRNLKTDVLWRLAE
jgi:hypothetical protein